MQPLDASVLGDGFTIVAEDVPREGAVGVVNAEGHLVHFGFYADGQLCVGATITRSGSPGIRSVLLFLQQVAEASEAARRRSQRVHLQRMHRPVQRHPVRENGLNDGTANDITPRESPHSWNVSRQIHFAMGPTTVAQ